MNYYTFNHFPNLHIKTFGNDKRWQKAKHTSSYINAITIKLIWGYKDDGQWPINLTDIRFWFERLPSEPTPPRIEPRIVLRTPFLRWP